MLIRRRDLVSAAASLAAVAAVTPARALAMTSRLIPGPDDPLGVRPDFRILENGRTFVNSAYVTPCPRTVPDAGAAFLQAKATRPITVGEMLGKANVVRAQFANLINATPDEIGFLFATTEGENAVANTISLKPGDNVVVDDLHYEGALVVYRQLEKRRGIELRIVRHRDGALTPADYARQVDARTRLVSVSYVSSVNGLRHDVRALADMAHAHGALMYVDAIQAVGMIPVDVRADDVDFLCTGTYKWLLGGFGIAPFYIRKALLDRLPPDRFGLFGIESQTPDHRYEVRKSARRYDYATLPFAEVHQLGAALSYLTTVGVPRIRDHTLALTRRLEAGLLEQGYKLFTPAGNQSSILCFYTRKPPSDVRTAFEQAKIDVTVRDDHVRVSFALFNNATDVDQVLAITKKLV
jgi:selenocysteine lyase/cysteine desulfurase